MIGINTFGLSELLRTNFYGTLQKLVRAATHANLRHYRLDGGIWFSGNNAIKRLETARSLGLPSSRSSLRLRSPLS